MQTTRKVAIDYGLWVLICVTLTYAGYGDAKAGHLYLIFTGAPISLLSLRINPNGSLFATIAAGTLGWMQWCLIAEAFSRWDAWKDRDLQ